MLDHEELASEGGGGLVRRREDLLEGAPVAVQVAVVPVDPQQVVVRRRPRGESAVVAAERRRHVARHDGRVADADRLEDLPHPLVRRRPIGRAAEPGLVLGLLVEAEVGGPTGGLQVRRLQGDAVVLVAGGDVGPPDAATAAAREPRQDRHLATSGDPLRVLVHQMALPRHPVVDGVEHAAGEGFQRQQRLFVRLAPQRLHARTERVSRSGRDVSEARLREHGGLREPCQGHARCRERSGFQELSTVHSPLPPRFSGDPLVEADVCPPIGTSQDEP